MELILSELFTLGAFFLPVLVLLTIGAAIGDAYDKWKGDL